MNKKYIELSGGSTSDHGEEDSSMLVKLLSDVVKEKILFISVVFVFSIAGLGYSFTKEKIYASESTLMSNQDLDNQFSGMLSGSLGSLGSLTGIDLASDAGTTSIDKALAIMMSREFVTGFVSGENLAPILFSEDWNSEQEVWKRSGWVSLLLQRLGLREEKLTKEPTPEALYLRFTSDYISHAQNPKNKLIKLKIEAPGRELAQQINASLIDRVNDTVKRRDINEAKANLAKLNQRLSKGPSLEIEQALFGLVETESKKVLMAEISPEYIFSVIDSPSISDDPVSPKRLLYVAAGLIAGLALGFILLLGKKYLAMIKAELSS